MQYASSIHKEIVEKVQGCLKELGFEPQTRISDQEGLVHARKEVDGQCVRIVLHVSGAEALAAASGAVEHEIARSRLTQAAIRPSLSAQAAARNSPPSSTKSGCD